MTKSIVMTGVALSLAANIGVAGQAHSQPAQSKLTESSIREGWRARQLIGAPLNAESDKSAAGRVNDIIIDKDGRIAALIVARGPLQLPDSVFRIPWSEIDVTRGKPGVSADLSERQLPRYGLFPGSEGVVTLPREFRATEVIGDYARLQTGQGYGYVTDVVFSQDGRVSAVLVASERRDGVSAFPFTGIEGRWDPGASYFGLPFVTSEQAEKAGIEIDPSQFSASSL